MKSISKALLAVLFFCAPSAKAAVDQVSCASDRDSSHELIAFISDQNLKALRFQNQGSLPEQVLTTRMTSQDFPDQTTYTMAFSNSIVYVDNSLLQGSDGRLFIDAESYSCNR